jgi:hypothetical protein
MIHHYFSRGSDGLFGDLRNFGSLCRLAIQGTARSKERLE